MNMSWLIDWLTMSWIETNNNETNELKNHKVTYGYNSSFLELILPQAKVMLRSKTLKNSSAWK